LKEKIPCKLIFCCALRGQTVELKLRHFFISRFIGNHLKNSLPRFGMFGLLRREGRGMRSDSPRDLEDI
jgi:hypothetical protein